jgi:hypothetical protein
MIDFEADAAGQQEPATLERAVKMAELLVQLRGNVDTLEKQLAVAKADVRRVEQEDLPELMAELGLETFRLKSGELIEVKQEVNCAITEEKRAAAHAWLTEHGFGGLIKTEVVVTFGRGEHTEAEEFVHEVEEQGKAPILQERVHPSTLKSFIKEQMAAGKPVPFDLFGVFPYNKVQISLKK